MNPTQTETNPIGIDDLRELIGELRMIARGLLKAEFHSHSFTPTALALTALRRAKLMEQDWTEVRWENRAHFFAAVAQAMRHALIDYARRRQSKGRENVLYFSPDENVFRDLSAEADERPDRLILIEEAVARLNETDARLANVVHQFYYVGYTTAEMAFFSGVSEKTIDRDLKRARAFLRKILDDLSRGGRSSMLESAC